MSAPPSLLGTPAERFTRRMFTRIIAGLARSTHSEDLSVAQVALLYMLDERQPLRISEVAAELGRSAPAASRLVDDLVGRKLVTRREDAADRRARKLELTPKGSAFVARASEDRIRVIIQTAGELPAEAAAEVLAAVSKLRQR